MIGAVVNKVLGEVEKAANEGINATDGGISADCDYRDATKKILTAAEDG